MPLHQVGRESDAQSSDPVPPTDVEAATPAATRRRPQSWTQLLPVKDLFLYIAGPAVVLATWEYVGRQGMLAAGMFPPFSDVVRAAIEWLLGVGGSGGRYSGTWVDHALSSTGRILVGFGIGSVIAVVLGVLVGWSPVIKKLVDPSVNVIRPISVTAWIPLALIIFGIGNRPAVFLTMLASFFPVYVSTVAGVEYAEGKLTRAALMLGANSRQLLTRVVLPAALPSILTGMRVAAAIAWTTVIVAEMLGAKSGLGYVLIDAYNFFQFDYVISAMFSVGFLGFITDRIVVVLSGRQLRWVGKGAQV